MLVSISISQFTITDHLEIEFQPGMTAITGETGTGKSITIDALGLALGNRGDSSLIKTGSDKTDIHAVFDVRHLPQATAWLKDNELYSDGECILRRILNKDGRSKAYINSMPVNLQQLKALGKQLVDIHSQHAHQRLMQREYHQQLLDAYAGTAELEQQTSKAYHAWHSSLKSINSARNKYQEADTRREYLQFQLEEFTQLAIHANEFAQLEQQHYSLANAESTQDACQTTLNACKDGSENVLALLGKSQQALEQLSHSDTALKESYDMLKSASITVTEACYSLRDRLSESANPANLQQIENRLAALHDLARKHRVEARDLLKAQSQLSDELAQLESSDAHIEQLQIQAEKQQQHYGKLAEKLSKKRAKAGKALTFEISQQLQLLGMGNCQFSVQLNTDSHNTKAYGIDHIEFLVSTNAGQGLQSLQKVASGGELSRISLAIQVITAKASTIPTLVFDEVDVGIWWSNGRGRR